MSKNDYLKNIQKIFNEKKIRLIIRIRKSGRKFLLTLIEKELKKRGVKQDRVLHISSSESEKYINIKHYNDTIKNYSKKD